MPSVNDSPEDQMLIEFLRAQRMAIREIVDGLSEDDWHRVLFPTGWNVAGLVAHLGGAEWHWFQGVVAGNTPELPGDLDDERPPYDPATVVLTADETSSEVLAFYQSQCTASDDVLARTPLSAKPLGLHRGKDQEEPPNVRWVVLHLIEETARHAGHLDIARELLDGEVRRGGR